MTYLFSHGHCHTKPSWVHRFFNVLGICINSFLICSVASCARLDAPVTRLATKMQNAHVNTIQAPLFAHGIFYHHGHADVNSKSKSADNSQLKKPPPPLLVFIHGDGTPWLGEGIVARDPTPEYSVAWELYERSHLPAIFITRPCYFPQVVRNLTYETTKCDTKYWTYARYAREVSESMLFALNSFLDNADFLQREVVLIGYSGGASIAIMLAKKMPRISGVVTIAGNLDHALWTAHHNYSPLLSSVNAAGVKLDASIFQVHYVGERDHNTPPQLNRRYYQLNQVTPVVVDHFTHQCCWITYWPNIANAVKKGATNNSDEK